MRGAISLVPLAVGLLLSALLLPWWIGERRTDLNELALGKETRSLYASIDGEPIHCETVEDAQRCLSHPGLADGEPVVLWLGNSQVHGVNQLREGEENAPPMLYRSLRERGVDLVTFSQPNANLQEHYVLFEYLRHRLPVRTVILPLVFDDLREAGLRAEIALALEDAATIGALGRTEVGSSLGEQRQVLAGGDLAGVRETLQEKSESALNGWIAEHSNLWGLRPQARGALFIRLYRLRNAAFGITPQSKRRMIPGRYASNLEALSALLEQADEADIDVLIYVAPLRGDLDIPYVAGEYDRFKQDARRIADRHGARLADLESLVPAELWGRKVKRSNPGTAEVDFMHFQAGGHRLLADALDRLLAERSGDPPR